MRKALIALLVVYFTIASYCNVKQTLGYPCQEECQ